MKATHKDESKTMSKDFTESKHWTEQAKPILNEMLSSWSLIPVESNHDLVSDVLNMKCGINYLLCRAGSPNVYGVVSRVQSGKNYRTFTVPKWRVNRSEGSANLRPYYTMQVYMSGDRIIGLGLIETDDLMEYIECGLAEVHKENYVCKWDDMRKAEYEVLEYRAEPVAEDMPKNEASHIEKHFRVYKNGQEYKDEEAMRELAKNVGMTYEDINEMWEEFFSDKEEF